MEGISLTRRWLQAIYLKSSSFNNRQRNALNRLIDTVEAADDELLKYAEKHGMTVTQQTEGGIFDALDTVLKGGVGAKRVVGRVVDTLNPFD